MPSGTQVINGHALLPTAILQSSICVLSGVPVGSQVQNQQKFFDPDDSSQSATTVGSFPSFGIHRWGDRWLVLLKLDWKLASSLLSRWVCAGDAAVETLCLEDEQINSSMQVVEGQVVFCLFFKAKMFLWFSEWIESYFLNSVISTLRSRTSFLSFLSSNLWLHSSLLIAIRIALILSAELFSFCYICQEISR